MLTTTTPSLLTQVVTTALNALAPVLSGLVDEYGQPYTTGGLRSAYSTEPIDYPSVIVSYRPGRTPLGATNSQLDLDDGTGLFLHGVYSGDGTIRVTVQARSEAEREYLVDMLFSGIQAKAVIDPNTGEAVDNAVQRYLSSFGIDTTDIAPVEYPAPRLDAARPEGLIYEATLPLICDVSLSWETPGVTTNRIEIDPGAQIGGALFPDIPVVVTR